MKNMNTFCSLSVLHFLLYVICMLTRSFLYINMKLKFSLFERSCAFTLSLLFLHTSLPDSLYCSMSLFPFGSKRLETYHNFLLGLLTPPAIPHSYDVG